MNRPILAVLLIGTVGGLTACGGEGTQTVTQVTVVKTESAVASGDTVTPEVAPAQEPAVAPADDTTTASKAASAAGKRISVPDVVGTNHQKAQDTMQAGGLFMLAEEDATGADRPLLWDRNWVVVSQSPAAGSRVDEDQTITLRSKKYSDG
jgi:hypothetical protein